MTRLTVTPVRQALEASSGEGTDDLKDRIATGRSVAGAVVVDRDPVGTLIGARPTDQESRAEQRRPVRRRALVRLSHAPPDLPRRSSARHSTVIEHP